MVSVNKNNTINILDIGARYGIHPSWKNFSGKANYHLIEADNAEASRLKKKYKNYYEKIFNENYPDINKFNEMKEFNPY